MGRYRVNALERWHTHAGVTYVELGLHLAEPIQGDPWDTLSGEIVATNWIASLPTRATSATATESAIVANWPGWWAQLTAPQRDATVTAAHARAVAIAAAFAA